MANILIKSCVGSTGTTNTILVYLAENVLRYLCIQSYKKEIPPCFSITYSTFATASRKIDDSISRRVLTNCNNLEYDNPTSEYYNITLSLRRVLVALIKKGYIVLDDRHRGGFIYSYIILLVCRIFSGAFQLAEVLLFYAV